MSTTAASDWFSDDELANSRLNASLTPGITVGTNMRTGRGVVLAGKVLQSLSVFSASFYVGSLGYYAVTQP
jgi:hypothetical protein